MEHKNASWIKGPLPPLAESILMSGLVSNKGASNNSIIVKSASSDSLENIHLHPPTSYTPINQLKQQQKKVNTPSPSVLKNDNIISQTVNATAKLTKSSNITPYRKGISISSISQQRNQSDDLNKTSKPKSDFVFVVNPKSRLNNTAKSFQNSNILESFGMGSTISTKHYGNASIGESTNNIVSELDANIALLNNPDQQREESTSQSYSDQLLIREKLIKIHNYSFNQLILSEKSICSDRALLLRRFMKFYNSLIDEIPALREEIKQQEESFSETVERIQQEKKEIEDKFQSDSNIEKELRDHILKLEEKNKELTEESNKKDLTISSTTFETDYLKGQIVQLQFKLQNKKQRRKMLKNAISQMEEECQSQLKQIDSLTKALEEMNQGETSYIQKYHRVSTELEKAKQEIEDLKTEMNNVPVIVKKDISVDTQDLPAPTKKRNPTGSLEQTAGKNKISTINEDNEDDIHFDTISNNKKQGKDTNSIEKPKLYNQSSNANFQIKKSNLSRRQTSHIIPFSFSGNSGLSSTLGNEKKKKNPPGLKTLSAASDFTQNMADIFNLIEKKTATIQTSPRLAETLQIHKDVIDYNNVNFSQEKSKSNDNFQKKEKKVTNQDEDKYQLKIDSIDFKCPLPDNYKVNIQEVEQVPDILKMIMPIMSRPYVGRHPTDLKILDNNVTTQHQIVSNEKPLIWALQLIHTFLLDPYVRSNEHLSKTSIEPIFIDWITNRYKLQHLVNQVITDFSNLLVSNRSISAVMSLFYDILEGQYTVTELSFFSTLYSFSNQFTYPSLPKCLEEMTIDSSGYDQFTIHITVAAKIFAKCFTDEICDTFLLKKANEIKEKEESPLINYFEFLKKSMEFFGDKHKLLYMQSKNLLMICGCSDPLLISYDPFVTFMTFLDYKGKELRKEWKAIKSLSTPVQDENDDTNHIDQSPDTVQLRDLMGFLAEKETQFVNLLNMIPMHQAVLTLKSFSSIISNLFIDLMKRFMKIKKIQEKFPPAINEKIKDDLNELKVSYLCANIPRILWYYRIILMKVDKGLMKEKGFIPFHPQSTIEVIKQLVEYLDRAESVSFALLC